MAELFSLVKYYNLPRIMNYGNYMDLYGIYGILRIPMIFRYFQTFGLS